MEQSQKILNLALEEEAEAGSWKREVGVVLSTGTISNLPNPPLTNTMTNKQVNKALSLPMFKNQCSAHILTALKHSETNNSKLASNFSTKWYFRPKLVSNISKVANLIKLIAYI